MEENIGFRGQAPLPRLWPRSMFLFIRIIYIILDDHQRLKCTLTSSGDVVGIYIYVRDSSSTVIAVYW